MPGREICLHPQVGCVGNGLRGQGPEARAGQTWERHPQGHRQNSTQNKVHAGSMPRPCAQLFSCIVMATAQVCQHYGARPGRVHGSFCLPSQPCDPQTEPPDL